MENVTDSFAAYLLRKQAGIGEELLYRAMERREDYDAVVRGGAAKNRERWSELLRLAPEGKARVFGYETRTDGKTAALINGFNAHSLELDDGHRFAMIHLGAAIISALSACRDETEIDENSFLLGIIMGYEAACRMAICVQPSHKQRGFHASGTCGTIGAAVACAAALGMDRRQLKRVISAAAGSAAGMLELQEQRSELKPYNLGRAAMDGLAAACMGLADFDVPDDMLGGERGFLRTFADSYDAEKLIEETDYYEIERIYVKPYASCRHSHSAVEAALRLHDRVRPEHIASVLVETYRLGVKGHDHRSVAGIASAKLSTPYAVAAALLYGRADLTVFEPVDAAAAALAERVIVTESPELTAECPRKRIAVVRILKTDGSEEHCRVDYAKGEPENPMTAEETADKQRLLKQYSEQRFS